MAIFLNTAAYGFEPIVSGIDQFPSGLNMGLLARYEVTNVNSYPGSGSVLNNLSTASLYSTSSTATVFSASVISSTEGIVLNGSSSRIDIGIISTYASGSYVINNAISESNEFTIAYLANLSGSLVNDTNVGLAAWNDYGGYIYLGERNNSSNNLFQALRSNTSYNNVNNSGYFVLNENKLFGTQFKFGTNGWKIWKGTASVATRTAIGTTFDPAIMNISPWTFGTRMTSTLGSFYNRYWKGPVWAIYIWNRALSDTEMGDLQNYLNTYVKENS